MAQTEFFREDPKSLHTFVDYLCTKEKMVEAGNISNPKISIKLNQKTEDLTELTKKSENWASVSIDNSLKDNEVLIRLSGFVHYVESPEIQNAVVAKIENKEKTIKIQIERKEENK